MGEPIVNKPKFGLYAGTFNPFHYGHWNIVLQAQQLFWRVIVARGVNPDKSQDDMTPLPNQFFFRRDVYVDTYAGLLTDYIRKIEAEYRWDVTLIRGLRDAADLGYERNLLTFLREMMPELKVVFFTCAPEFQHISSSALRGIRQFSEQDYLKYVIQDITEESS